jgi:hypothetical protein
MRDRTHARWVSTHARARRDSTNSRRARLDRTNARRDNTNARRAVFTPPLRLGTTTAPRGPRRRRGRREMIGRRDQNDHRRGAGVGR